MCAPWPQGSVSTGLSQNSSKTQDTAVALAAKRPEADHVVAKHVQVIVLLPAERVGRVQARSKALAPMI